MSRISLDSDKTFLVLNEEQEKLEEQIKQEYTIEDGTAETMQGTNVSIYYDTSDKTIWAKSYINPTDWTQYDSSTTHKIDLVYTTAEEFDKEDIYNLVISDLLYPELAH